MSERKLNKKKRNKINQSVTRLFFSSLHCIDGITFFVFSGAAPLFRVFFLSSCSLRLVRLVFVGCRLPLSILKLIKCWNYERNCYTLRGWITFCFLFYAMRSLFLFLDFFTRSLDCDNNSFSLFLRISLPNYYYYFSMAWRLCARLTMRCCWHIATKLDSSRNTVSRLHFHWGSLNSHIWRDLAILVFTLTRSHVYKNVYNRKTDNNNIKEKKRIQNSRRNAEHVSHTIF